MNQGGAAVSSLESEKRGRGDSFRGLAQVKLLLPTPPLVASSMGLLEFKGKLTQKEDSSGRAPRRVCTGFLVLKGFICFWKMEILGKISAFPGVPSQGGGLYWLVSTRRGKPPSEWGLAPALPTAKQLGISTWNPSASGCNLLDQFVQLPVYFPISLAKEFPSFLLTCLRLDVGVWVKEVSEITWRLWPEQPQGWIATNHPRSRL